MALTLYLVRHGQSHWNLARRVQGQSPDAPGLTERGRAQAAEVAAGLGPVDRVLTSDLVRAAETAAIIAGALGLAAEADPRLREQSMGSLEGLLSADAWGELQGVDWTDATRLGGERGETGYEVQARVGSLLAELIAAEGAGGPSSILLVGHGGSIRRAVAVLTATAPGRRFAWDADVVANGAITTAVLDGGALVELSG